ncbi:hypothetical protein AXG93_4316s1300 [Marchantia polymorpha subsp. ruderalis]|uniref:Reverse transcriptase Ty1/copia-type domain-containing protein n=1 Tax=Marchantia polymorpha subsp. ruderalis TaxID=1480154 RepID=A0A176VRU9_MARPO|nr:hypothetical protein AXG93_4316s1300 [Marchantia polymorpha subsp. ruderalis]
MSLLHKLKAKAPRVVMKIMTRHVQIRYMSNPGKERWLAMKHLLRYLKVTSDVDLMYCKSGSSVQVESYVDSDYAWNKDSMKSTTAYQFLINGNCVRWKSQLQPVVTLFTAKAEYIVAIEAMKEGIWIQGLLKELHVFQGTATLFFDRQSAIYLCKNLVFHDRTKHVDIKYHFIREKIIDGDINIAKISIDDNLADCGTKVVTLGKFRLCVKLFGVDAT